MVCASRLVLANFHYEHGELEVSIAIFFVMQPPSVTRKREIELKILLITKQNPYGLGPFGGAETSTRLLAEKMAARGHQVTYLTLRADVREQALAWAEGVELVAFPRLLGRRFRLFQAANWMLVQRKIRTLALRNNFDLIYCFYELEVLEAALRVRAQLGWPKVIMRMAGLKWYVDSMKSPNHRKRYQAAFRALDSVNFISDGLVAMTEEKLAELKMPVRFRDSFVQDIGSGVAVGRSSLHAAIPPSPFRIVMAARFSIYQKRQDLLIKAVALLPRDLPLIVTLVGEGKRLADMKALAAELSVDNRIEFIPFLDQPALWSRFEQAHLMCHAADYEGLGKAIVEAMAKGLPVLASDVAPLNGYIREGINGFLVANTPETWAARIAELNTRREDLAHVSAAAMAFAADRWDADRSAKVYEEFFSVVTDDNLRLSRYGEKRKQPLPRS